MLLVYFVTNTLIYVKSQSIISNDNIYTLTKLSTIVIRRRRVIAETNIDSYRGDITHLESDCSNKYRLIELIWEADWSGFF